MLHSLDSIASLAGLVQDETYPVDIFFAHRGASSTPSFRLELSAVRKLATGYRYASLRAVLGRTL